MSGVLDVGTSVEGLSGFEVLVSGPRSSLKGTARSVHLLWASAAARIDRTDPVVLTRR
jgi:hypothetical protein